MIKSSVSRKLEMNLVSKLLNSRQVEIKKVVDLGGEANSYNDLFKKHAENVVTFNLASKSPDRIVDLTQSFFDALVEERPDYIVSINTI